MFFIYNISYSMLCVIHLSYTSDHHQSLYHTVINVFHIQHLIQNVVCVIHLSYTSIAFQVLSDIGNILFSFTFTRTTMPPYIPAESQSATSTFLSAVLSIQKSTFSHNYTEK